MNREITLTTFPPQADNIGKRVEVLLFSSDFKITPPVVGTIVRSDANPAGIIIIRLDDGRYVLGSECSYRDLPGFKW